jgi:hypothetical protein
MDLENNSSGWNADDFIDGGERYCRINFHSKLESTISTTIKDFLDWLNIQVPRIIIKSVFPFRVCPFLKVAKSPSRPHELNWGHNSPPYIATILRRLKFACDTARRIDSE